MEAAERKLAPHDAAARAAAAAAGAPRWMGPVASPVPRRYWWLKRLAVGYVLWFVLIVGVRIWWGAEAQRRLDQRIDSYRAAGQPVLIEDFEPTPVPDEDNAAPLWEKAAAAIVQQEEDHYYEDFLKPSYAAKYPDEFDALIAANAGALQFAEEAAAKPAIDWGARFTNPPPYMLFARHYSGQRAVAKMLAIAARHDSRQGIHAAAVARVEQMLDAAEDTGTAPVELMGHYAWIAIEALAAAALEALVPSMQIHGAAAEFDSAAADRAAVERLIVRLLDDQELREHLRLALYAERMSAIELVEGLLDGTFVLGAAPGSQRSGARALYSAATSPVSPLVKLDLVYMLDFNAQVLGAVEAASWTQVREALPPNPASLSDHQQLKRTISSFWLSSPERMLELHHRTLARRRMAGLSLALVLYRQDHGELPAMLGALTPTYLGTLPADPFRAEGGTFGYLPHADEPRLYTVGPDGVDDGGAYAIASFSHTTETAVDLERLDPPFFLTAARPKLTPPEPAGKGGRSASRARRASTPIAAETQPATSQPGSPPRRSAPPQ